MRPTTRRARIISGDDGVVALELALVLPFLLLLIFGTVEFGRAYNANVQLTGAVREGTRVLALKTGDPVATTKASAPGLDPTRIDVTTSSSPCTAGDDVWVQAEYDFDLDIPFYTGANTLTIRAKGVMRCGG